MAGITIIPVAAVALAADDVPVVAAKRVAADSAVRQSLHSNKSLCAQRYTSTFVEQR